jgi:hypothetical protein
MTEIASLTPIYGGISHDRLDDHGLQWPCPEPDHPGLFTRGEGLPDRVENGQCPGRILLVHELPAQVGPQEPGERRRGRRAEQDGHGRHGAGGGREASAVVQGAYPG